MKYGYTVKYNGEYYPAGVDVPEEEEEVKKETSSPSKKKSGRPPKEKE